MRKVKYLTIGGLCTALAVLFQVMPVFLTEAALPLSILSIIPIYFVTRLNSRIGFQAYMASGLLIMFITVHEGLIFFFANGIAALSLATFTNQRSSKILCIVLSTMVLTCSLLILNFAIGFPLFGGDLSISYVYQSLLILIVAFIYCILMGYLCEFTFRILKTRVFAL